MMASFADQFGLVELPPPSDAAAFSLPFEIQASTSSTLAPRVSATPKPTHYDIHGRPLLEPQPVASPAKSDGPAAPSLTGFTHRPHPSVSCCSWNRQALMAASSASAVPSSSSALTKRFLQWYVEQRDHLKAVTTAEFFKRETANRATSRNLGKDETVYWSLFEILLQDAEHSVSLHPEVIGIEVTQPHRRWFISHYAHIQHLLMHQPVLRVANVICLWLEEIYRQSHPSDPRLHSSEEPIVLRQLILTYVRGGEMHKAIDAAVTCKSCAYSCLLSAAQLQTVEEPWMAATRVVPLFGEYAHGALAQSWTGNTHRLNNLSQLYDESSQHVYAQSCDTVSREAGEFIPSGDLSFEAVIGAALCGHLNVLESAFLGNGHQRWQDVVWCYLRCQLIIAFTKKLMCAGHRMEGRYAAYVESFTGTQDGWEAAFAQQMVRGLVQRLEHFQLLRDNTPGVETLQLRLVLQALTSTQNAQSEWFQSLSPTPGNGDEARRLTHTYLLLDAAYRESLLAHSVQVHASEAVCAAMCQHAGHVALLPIQQPSAAPPANHTTPGRHTDGMHGVLALAQRVKDPLHRAHVYAAFLISVREVELDHGDRSKEDVEEQESQMIRLFVDADTDSTRMRQEVLRVLDQKVVCPEDLLTHHKYTERLLWEAMHCQSEEDYEGVTVRCLEAAHNFWCASVLSSSLVTSTAPSAEIQMEIFGDINKILQQRVLPYMLLERRRDDDEVSSRIQAHFEAASFWSAFAEAYDISVQHTKVAGDVGLVVAARTEATTMSDTQLNTEADRTLAFQLGQEEGALLLKLVRRTRDGIHMMKSVLNHPTTTNHGICCAAVFLVQQLTENIIMSFLSHTEDNNLVDLKVVNDRDSRVDCEANSGALSLLQVVFELVEVLDASGYLKQELLPQSLAAGLFTKIRTLRVTYSQRQHEQQVRRLLQQSGHR